MSSLNDELQTPDPNLLGGNTFDYQPNIRSPSRIYEVGKYKEYRQLIGKEKIKNHIEQMHRNKRRSAVTVNENLSDVKFKKGHQI